MLSACIFGVLLTYPGSAVAEAIDSTLLRRTVGGVAMGLTAIGIIRSPLGQRSGAHLNPAVTTAFWLVGKVRTVDALGYIASQFIGAVAGMYVADVILGMPLRHAAVEYVVTRPGVDGTNVALFAEALISFVMMAAVLFVSNTRSLSRYTPYVAGILIAIFITFESPYSGMSMNPARTLGSAVVALNWTALWVYFVAPVPAMAIAAVAYRSRAGNRRVYCAKLDHHNKQRCIFNCRFGDM